MPLDSVLIDGDDFSLGLMPELEKSFGVRFPRDLRHVRTVGDLFDELMRLRPSSGEGEREGMVMTFNALRRALAPLWRETDPRPATPLADQELPWPREVRAILERETGLAVPRPPMSAFTLIAVVALGALGAWAFWDGSWWTGLGVGAACLAVGWFDPGEFAGDWKTLGSLARAVSDANYDMLAEKGARDSEAAAWRTFTALVAREAAEGNRIPHPAEIARETLLDVDGALAAAAARN
ncbi:hypothetical protein [Sphingomonas sp.]|uniref:hypothetical protein n=1 Tax=Sphingomonas sp. TaxID=28214 RepID=UPI001B2DC5D6|nr:hypothetical protein [Sphingomonas sp.]MBO9712574.1 hypothetical protein [Sphingomonas sp.]